MIFLFKSVRNINFSRFALKQCPKFFFAEDKKLTQQQIIKAKKPEEFPIKEILSIDEKLLFNLNEYKQALFYFSNEKYRISQEFFKRVLTYLESNNQHTSDNYIYILKK